MIFLAKIYSVQRYGSKILRVRLQIHKTQRLCCHLWKTELKGRLHDKFMVRVRTSNTRILNANFIILNVRLYIKLACNKTNNAIRTIKQVL